MRQSSKDTTSNLFNRYVWLVDLIHRTGRISYEAINERWVVSSLNPDGEDLPLRTFHNHIIAVQQMFDINIECDRKNGYGYYIENADELSRDGVRSWLLSTFAVNNLIADSQGLRERIVFENIPSGQRFLLPIIEAMRDGKVLEVVYHPFWQDEPFTMQLHPYFVKVFRQRWYVIGYNPYNDDARIYALDRIEDLHLTDETFAMPADFSPSEFFAHCYGISVDGGDPERTVLRASDAQAKYLRALPLHPSQTEESPGIFAYFLSPHAYDFKQAVLSFMGEVEVLAPQSLRDELKEIIGDMAAKYRTGNS
jgi:predicted DNA-binding transcriptional regulator YafY